MKQVKNTIWGLVFIIIGVIVGLNAFGFTKIDIFFDGWWTLFIIVPCFIDLFNSKEKTGNIIGIIIGVLLLLACNDLFSFDIILKLLLPIILVGIGLSFIFKNNSKIKKEITKIEKNSSDLPSYCATFSGNDVSFAEEEFNGCSIDAIFGGAKLNLADAIVKKDVVINATCVFGGITIFVPDDVNVKINSTSIFGGVDDPKNRNGKISKEKNAKTIYINATCVFGGIEIK